jgi:hypothetical protein
MYAVVKASRTAGNSQYNVHRQTLRSLFLISSVLEFNILMTADLVTMKNRVFF